jgi:hypothetical protein
MIQPVDTSDSKSKELVLKFMRMLWKSAKKIAFGQILHENTYNVVAWYCTIS